MRHRFTLDIEPVGYVRGPGDDVPRHYSVSEKEGEIVVYEKFVPGLRGLVPGDPDRIMVVFLFDQSPPFTADRLMQIPPTRSSRRGVFLTCSPVRPNPFGVSILQVLEIEKNVIRVRGLDMLDKTPILDIKPWKPEFCV